MRRPLLLLLALFAVGAFMFQTSRATTARFCGQGDTDELAWLRTEFQLSDADLAKVRALHESYRPQCTGMCQRMASKNEELFTLTTISTNVSSEMKQKLAEAASLRAECQAEMLLHFYYVSRAMPPEQGRRYLSTMCRMTLTEPLRADRELSHGADHGKH